MGIVLSILYVAFPMLAASVGYAYGPRMQSFHFRFAGRETRLQFSGFDLSILILVAGMLLGLQLPSVSTNCNLRGNPAVIETSNP